MSNLLITFLELFFEATLEFAAGYLGALIMEAVAEAFNSAEFKNSRMAAFGYLILGGMVGGASLFLFTHSLVHRFRVPGLSLVLSPLLAGLGMSFLGSTLRRQNKRTMQIEGFGYGFAFAFGIALVRFVFVE